MTSQDVRSILNLPQAGPSSAPAPKKLAKAARKPDGISRELYALIGDHAPSLAEAQASTAAVRYRDRPKLKGKKVKWSVNTSLVETDSAGSGPSSRRLRARASRARRGSGIGCA